MEKLQISIKIEKGNLSIQIECAEGSLYTSNLMKCDDVVATRYMVAELRNDKNTSRAFDVNYEEVQ